MAGNLDKSLDELSEGNRRGGRRGGGGGRGRGGRRPAAAGFNENVANPLSRDYPDTMQDVRGEKRPRRDFQSDGQWSHDGFDQISSYPRSSGGGGGSEKRLQAAGKVVVSGLDKNMSEAELKELFMEQSKLSVQQIQMNYNQQGVGNGTAEVTFRSAADAERAAADLDHALIDGLEMRVQVVSRVVVVKNVVRAPPQQQQQMPVFVVDPRGQSWGGRGGYQGGPRNFNRGGGRPQSTRGGGRGAPRGGARGGGRGGRGGRGGGGARAAVSAEDLDKELDSYHSTASPAAPSPMLTGQP